MTSAAASQGWHAAPELLASYAAGRAGEAEAWSVEAHLAACPRCRGSVAATVDPARLARNRSALLVRVAVGDGGWAFRVLRRCGVPDHVLRLLGATPSLRRSWLLSVAGVLAVVTAEAALARHGLGGAVGRHDPEMMTALVPFLLAAPLLALAGVAAAFLPPFDPAYRVTIAAPFSGWRLLLVRAVCALAAAAIPAACAAFAVPGPGWLPAAFLLPSLAVCAVALAALTVTGPLPAALLAGVVWVLPVLLLAGAQLPLAAVSWHGQAVAAGVLAAAAVVALLRRDRFELGWGG